MTNTNEMVTIPTWMFKFAAWLLGGVGVVCISILMFAMQINTRLAVIESEFKTYTRSVEKVDNLTYDVNNLKNDVEILKNRR